ncbi:MAG TPA: hypothetical protein VIG08_02665 [Gemmatimonadales bacterium]|jgi:hypothetical protein
MSSLLRVFINGASVDVAPGSDVGAALRAHDPALAERVVAGTAVVTDARGIEMGMQQSLAAGSILRVVVRARRGAGSVDADA